MLCLFSYFFFQRYSDHRYLHVLTPSFPTRRSSDLDRVDMYELVIAGYFRENVDTCLIHRHPRRNTHVLPDKPLIGIQCDRLDCHHIDPNGIIAATSLRLLEHATIESGLDKLDLALRKCISGDDFTVTVGQLFEIRWEERRGGK